MIVAGINDPDDPTIAVTEFLPSEVTVGVGQPVRWAISGPEPHSVTFLADGIERPAPGTPEEFAMFAPGEALTSFDGSATVNSGLFPLGPADAPLETELTFPAVGEYQYFCLIHPAMTGTVNVIEAGGDTAADVTARGDEQREAWLAEGRAAKQALMDASPVVTVVDGVTNHEVQMGATTEHTDILAFSSLPAVPIGDTVTFVNGSGAPHTATFSAPDELLTDPLGPTAQAANGAQPGALTAGTFWNTGWLPPAAPPDAPPPLEARSFTFTASEAGTFDYLCLLHLPSAMAASITVT